MSINHGQYKSMKISSQNELEGQSIELYQSQILIIDDEPMNVDIMTDLLETEGYENITSETNPIKGLNLYEKRSFDIILLDINMPELDGFGVMKKIKFMNKPLVPPILILTALHRQEICNRALESGATDFINKPFNSDEALNRIKNLLNSYHTKKHLIEINDNLENLVNIRTKELIESKLKVIQHLGFAAEYRDTETAAHTIRVGEYSRLLGKKLGLENKMVDLLHQAAPLHDIGKIGIPDAILLKPGKFEPDEWKIMKTHTSIGAEILENDNDPLIVMARSIALNHHEKWNGKGYPNGLSGNNIPIEGRIVMLADVYDALTMVRPYKAAWTTEETIAFIKKESGTSFDPDIVHLFLGIINDFLTIRQECLD